MTAIVGDLTGWFFYTFDEEGDQDFQGQILGQPEPEYYFCQFFSWALGEPSCAKLAHISDMTNWAFYQTQEEWQNAGNSRKNHGRALNGNRKETPINDVFSR